MKKLLHLVLVFFFTFSFFSTLAISSVFAADEIPFTINKASYANTAAIIKDARKFFKSGKISEALQLYQYASEVVNAEKEPILRRKILDEQSEVQIAVDQEFQRQKMLKINQLTAKAIVEFRADKLTEAEASFKEVLGLDEANKDAKNYIEKLIPQRVAALKEERQRVLEAEQQKTISGLYAKARAYYKEEFYDEAGRVFDEILAIDLDQRDAENYVAKLIPQGRICLAKKNLNKAAREKKLAALEERMKIPMAKRAKAMAKREHQVAAKMALAGVKKHKKAHAKKLAALSIVEQPRVMVREAKFTGNSIFDENSLKKLVAADLGKELSLDELKQIAEKVKVYYNDGGYFLAQVVVPEQDLKAQDGVVNFTVLEGRLGEMKVAGNKRMSEKRIRQAMFSVRPQEPLRKQNLERSLLVLNSYAGLETSSVFKQGAEIGTTDLSIEAKEKNLVKGSLGVNNYGLDTTGKYRISPELNFLNLTGRGDRLDAKWIDALDVSSMYYGSVNYMTPVGSNGFQLKGYGTRSSFAVGKEYAKLNIKSKSTSWGIGASYPHLLSATTSITSEAWFEAKDFEQTWKNPSFNKDDRIRKARVELFTFDHQDLKGRTLLGLGIHQGLGEEMGAMKNDSPRSSRPYGKADNTFTKFTPSFARVQSVTDKILLVGRLSGQYTTDPVVAGEQWSIGGVDSVHGHQSGTYLGGGGYMKKMEERYTLLSPKKSKYQLLAFGDHGLVHTQKPDQDTKAVERLSGTGLGFYADINGMFDVRLDYGVPVGKKTGDDSIVSFEVKYKF